MVDREISDNIEEYLEVLYRNGNNKEQISTTKLSKELNIAPGSVTQMLKKLESLEYITYVPYKGAILTDKGMKIAQKITRKHRIIEKFLIDILKIKKENVHIQACDMEHSLSDEAERALCLMLEYPAVCPDNNIIPACNFEFDNCIDCFTEKNFDFVKFREKNLLSLSELNQDIKGKVFFIRGNNDTFNEIISLGVKIGSDIEFYKDSQNEDFVSILINENEINIPLKIANNIFIEI